MMEEIELSFPLVICRDIVENPSSEVWRPCQASISTGKHDGKKTLGSVRARVGEKQIVELIVTFPRHKIKFPTCNGKLRCHVELGQTIGSELGVSSSHKKANVDRKARGKGGSRTDKTLHDRTADDEVGCGPDTPQVERDYITKSDPVIETARPQRRREKPSKYKDYVASADVQFSKQRNTNSDESCKTKGSGTGISNTENRHLQSQTTDSVKPASQGNFEENLDKNVEAEGVTIQKENGGLNVHRGKKGSSNSVQIKPKTKSGETPSERKRTVRNYDKLIKSLHQASTNSGLEIQSVLSGLKASSTTYQNATENPQDAKSDNNKEESHANTVDGDTTGKQSGGTETGIDANSSDVTNRTITDVKKILKKSLMSDLKSKAKKTNITARTSSSHLTSFPRKFPSSLTRTDVFDVSLSKPSTVETLKRVAGRTDFVESILSKYRKIHPSSKPVNPTSAENAGCEDSGEELELKKKGMTSDKKTRNPQPSDHSEGAETMTGHPKFIITDSQGNPVKLGVPSDQQQPQGSHPQAGDSRKRKGSVNPVHQTPTVVTMADHDYADPAVPKKHDFSTRALKTLVKPISMARHISARVERVEEGEGSSLVTISGLNTKAGKRRCPDANITLKLNREGLPIADSLDDVTTDSIKSREKYWESYRLAKAVSTQLKSDIRFHNDDIPVIMNEVVLTPSGCQHVSRHNKICQTPKNHPKTLPLLKASLNGTSQSLEILANQADESFLDASPVGEKMKSDDSNTIIVQMTKDGWQEIADSSSALALNSISFDKFTQNTDHDASQQVTMNDYSVSCGQPSTTVPIENEEETAAESVQETSGTICRYCLRMFPTSVFLYKHVKKVHSVYADDSGYCDYLLALRHENRIECPLCPDSTTLSNEYKLRAHLTNFHGTQVYEMEEGTAGSGAQWCEACRIHFHTLNEFKTHATLIHNADILTCDGCSRAFIHKDFYEAHRKEAHSEQGAKLFWCKTCECSFESKQLFNIHRQQVHKRKVDQPVLSSRIKIKGAAKVPVLKRSLQVNNVKCPYCPALFPSVWQMKEHKYQFHSGPVPLHCMLCGLGFQSLAFLHAHLKHHLGHDTSTMSGNNIQTDPYDGSEVGDRSSIGCPFCGLVVPFLEMGSLVTHLLKIHSEQFPHACQVCWQRFVGEEHFQIHMHQAHQLAVVVDSEDPVSAVTAQSSTIVTAMPILKALEMSGRVAPVVPTLPAPMSAEDKISACPASETLEPDFFFSLPLEVQRSIEKITQRGKRAVITINDGKGGERTVSFAGSQSQSDALPLLSSPFSESAAQQSQLGAGSSGPVLEGGAMISDNSSAAMADETQSAVENLVFDVSFGTETEVVEAPSGAAYIVGNIIPTPGLEAIVENPSIEMEVVLTDSADSLPTEAEVISAGSEVVIDGTDYNREMEGMVEIIPHPGQQTEVIEIDPGSTGVVKETEIVMATASGVPGEVVTEQEVETEREGATIEMVVFGDQEGGVVELSTLSSVTVHDADSSTFSSL